MESSLKENSGAGSTPVLLDSYFWSQSANILISPPPLQRMLLRLCSPAVRQSTINYAVISFCWNQFWQQFKETDTSGAAGCEGWKNPNQIWPKQPFYFLLQISNWADLWGNLWVKHKTVICPFRLNRLRFVPKSGARMELFLVFVLLEMVLMSAGARGE